MVGAVAADARRAGDAVRNRGAHVEALIGRRGDGKAVQERSGAMREHLACPHPLRIPAAPLFEPCRPDRQRADASERDHEIRRAQALRAHAEQRGSPDRERVAIELIGKGSWPRHS